MQPTTSFDPQIVAMLGSILAEIDTALDEYRLLAGLAFMRLLAAADCCLIG